MATTVPAHRPARQASAHSPAFHLGALSLVSGIAIHGVTSLDLAWIVVVILVLVVVIPAVWSDKGYRRKAGLEVLDRLLLWRW